MIRALLHLILIHPLLALGLPIKEGLILRLDASDAPSLTIDHQNRVTAWQSLSGKATFTPANQGPTLVKNSLGGKPVLHFEKNDTLRSIGALTDQKELTVFIVFRRQGKNHSPWQRVLTNGTQTKGLSFDLSQNKGPVSTRVLRGSFKQDLGPDLWLGSGDTKGWGSLTGDIAEILIYNRTFYVEEPIAKIVTYLEKKWAFTEDRTTDWTLSDPLPKKPDHTNQKLPLSDQKNIGKWQEYQEMWDEFQGPLNSKKWWDHNPNWYGRAPARFLPREIATKNGQLSLTMTKDPSLPKEKLYGKNGSLYENYSSGTIKSKKMTTYGYFEIEAQAMPSAASSAWWFAGTSTEIKNKGTWTTEIDVFEIGARSPGHEHSYNMNAHIFRTPSSKRHWNKGSTWTAPFKFDEGFHIYGLEWTPDFIRYYVDGSLVRSMKNTHWHSPMNMIFDSETMLSWLGTPRDEDLPSAFRVKYVRAWKNTTTRPKWWESYRIKEPTNSRVTRYIRERQQSK